PMDTRLLDALPEDLFVDLLRSCWLVETARSKIFSGWSGRDDRYESSAKVAEARAAIAAGALEGRNKKPDHDLVVLHAAWMDSVVGPLGDDPLSPLFMVRLGDWVDGHLGPLIDEGDRLKSLSEEDRATLQWPESMPVVPPYEPLEVPHVDPPRDTLFRFGILGDLHVGSPRAEPLVRAAIADLNASGAELVVQLGDITDEGKEDQFRRAAELLQTLRMPVATMMGNHDVLALGDVELTGRSFYATSFGRDADGVLLEHKGWRFAVLDSATHLASPFTAFDLVTGSFLDLPGGAVVRGSLTVPQHEILAELAEPGAPPAFVFLHHPPQPYMGFPPILFGLRDADTGRLHAVADSGNVWGVFAGHTHRNAITRRFGRVPCVEVGIPRDFPFGYALVDVSPGGYSYQFVQVSDEELLHDAYRHAGGLQRRYAQGRVDERAFSWAPE
ncbi:MAG TPA: metallophosphoesterase, partial [Actinomycetota bacterium]|nr:metallophosphoesterase [Actinomycetota bacterium]